MKKIIIVLLFIGLRATTSLAQTDSLVYDENNKLIYYQVITQASSPADTLYKRALAFFKKSGYTADRLKLVKEDKDKTTLQGKGGVLVSKRSLVATHEDASIGFTMIVETKDDKYRFWLTDFIITPYVRDRYANYVPTTGKNTPLEKGLDKLSKKDYDGYVQKVLSNCREINTILRSYMKNQPVVVKEMKKKTITTKEW